MGWETDGDHVIYIVKKLMDTAKGRSVSRCKSLLLFSTEAHSIARPNVNIISI